ncbi:MAG: hypothetical protein AAGG81_03755 [Chlamydiota bacterium]
MEENHQSEQLGQKIHQPEFVVVTEEYKESVSEGQYKYQSGKQYETFEKLNDIRPSFPIRFACLFSSFILFCATIFGFCVFLLFCLSVCLTFGQVESLNNFTKSYWGTIRKVFVTAVGLLVAVFSPAFGLGIIVLYFIMVAGGTSDPVFSKFFESRLYKG